MAPCHAVSGSRVVGSARRRRLVGRRVPDPEIIYRPRPQVSSSSLSLSGLFLVLDVAPDNLGHVGILLFGLLDEGGIVEGLVIELHVLVARRRVARAPLRSV